MKAKLLKKLRKKIKIVEYPGRNLFLFIGPGMNKWIEKDYDPDPPGVINSRDQIIKDMKFVIRVKLLEYARKHYSNRRRIIKHKITDL